MRIEQLRQFIEVARCRSVNAASKVLHISQQNLSSSIKILEKEMAVPLIAKTNNGCELTECGKKLLDFAQEVTLRYNNLVYELRTCIPGNKNFQEGIFYVYIDYQFFFFFHPEVIQLFCQKHPFIRVIIQDLPCSEIFKKLTEEREYGSFCIGIINIPMTAAGELCPDFLPQKPLSFVPIRKGNYYACINKSKLRSGRKKEFSLETLLKHPILIGATDIKNDSPLSYLLTRYGNPNFMFSTASINLWVRMIAKDIGIGFINELFLNKEKEQEELISNISIVKIKEKLESTLGYILPTSPNEVINDFIEILKFSIVQ